MNGLPVLCLALSLFGGSPATEPAEPVRVSELALEGSIDGENITFELDFRADVRQAGSRVVLVAGDVAFLAGDLPGDAEIIREGDRYLVEFGDDGVQHVNFQFASRPTRASEWRRTRFSIPAASVRRLAVQCDRDDLEIEFPGALDVVRGTNEQGRATVTAFLGVSDTFEIGWKPEVRKLESDLVVSCDAHTIAAASVGALRMNTVFTYRVIQGALESLSLSLPDVNITQVLGEDIQDWSIDRSDPEAPCLTVSLGRPKEDVYRLQVESERVLPEFPCTSDLPVIRPLDVIRTSGFLLVGTDSAIKLGVKRAAGLTQIDPALFPTVAMGSDTASRAVPGRSVFAYQFANMPYRLELEADDIVSVYSADNRLVLSLADNELSFDASVELTIKDAPLRDIVFETDADPTWTVTSVTGQQVAETDVDIREEGEGRSIRVPFCSAVSGTVLVSVRMEKTLPPEIGVFGPPSFTVRGARSERGYLVAAAEKGIQLKAEQAHGLRDVHTGSAPMRVAGAQQAFRFKEAGWQVSLAIQRTAAAVHSEVFHLVSLGEGVVYESAAITYHVSGSPVQEFRIRVPVEIEAAEFTGADIEGWTRDEDVYTVRLGAKVLGDYTLLVTYDRQFDYEGDEISVGDVETVGTESEVGYIAVASSASLKVEAAEPLPPPVIDIDREEIPSAYSAPVTAPIIGSFKYTRAPHRTTVKVRPYATERLLEQVADYIMLSTIVSKDGEAVTTASYYIKNASRQYLVLSLPPEAELWTIKLIDENDVRRDVLSQENDGKLLIPVRRPRDPNTALRVELVYAQRLGAPGFWRTGLKGLRLRAPDLTETHATFASWKVELPDGFALANVGGNMTPTRLPADRGLLSALGGGVGVFGALLDGPGGRRPMGCLVVPPQVGKVCEFTRTVNLAGVAPLVVRLYLVPGWMGEGGSPRVLLLGAMVSLFALAIGFRLKRAMWVALGLTAILLAASESLVGRGAIGVLLAIGIGAAIVIFLFKMGFRWMGRMLRALWRAGGVCLGGLPHLLSGVGRTASRRSRRRSDARRHRRTASERLDSGTDFPMPFEEQQDPDDSGSSSDTPASGSVRVSALLLLGLTCLGVSCLLAEPVSPQVVEPQVVGAALRAAPREGHSSVAAGQVNDTQDALQQNAEGEEAARRPGLVVSLVDVDIVGPSTDREAEQSAAVTMKIFIDAPVAGALLVVPASCVLTDYEFKSRHLSIASGPEGYVLSVARRGTYEVQVKSQCPVREENGRWVLDLRLPPNKRNRTVLTLPEGGLDVDSETAVLFRITEATERTVAEAVFGPGDTGRFAWRPRIRRTQLEQALYFCEVGTFVALKSGVADLYHTVGYQIAQGEVRELQLLVPSNMTVTAVQAPGLATWSFDPESRRLDAILERPVTGSFALKVVTQVATEGLPYSLSLGALRVPGASRLRGAIAVAAAETVQVKLGEPIGLHPMNTEDFPAGQRPAGTVQAGAAALTMRRAFRYHEPETVAVTVEAEQVLPELRVVETATLSIGDERIVLASKLALSVAKSGVFSVEMMIPQDYDVETLSGPDVSHWDEPADAPGKVVVHLSRQVADATELNLVVARSEKGIESRIDVPRITVDAARKHTGRLTVSGERGVRLMVDEHRGVDVRKASEEGIQQAGVLLFDILRPTWSVSLATEVMAPSVKPEILQWVDLAEGMLQCRAYIEYRIENAGVKSFLLQAPMPGTTLSVTGRNIARVHESDAEAGVWQVDLHGKVENVFPITVSYQIPFETTEEHVQILPLRTVGTEPQRGYLVVTCAGRIQVEAVGSLAGLKSEDARSIPTSFGAGDLSNAIYCYRTIRSDFQLDLSVVRHESADVLPASVERVDMTTVLSTSDELLTHVALDMRVGEMRLLPVRLPDRGDALWTVLVNGKEVAASRDGEQYFIPLEEMEGGAVTAVDLVYAGALRSSAIKRRRILDAPSFGLPLRNIAWTLFVPPGFRYYDFDGAFEPVSGQRTQVVWFDSDQYLERNKAHRAASIQKARDGLDAGEQLIRAGQQKRARQVLQQAFNYSQGKDDLNEDARVQLQNLVKQQFKMGLVNRRAAVRYSNSMIDEEQLGQMEGFQNGNFTQDYADQVERGLSEKDSEALEVVAGKLIEQQAAAAGVLTAINITMPERGRQLRFVRELHIDPEGDLNIVFRTGRQRGLGWVGHLWPAALVFILLWALVANVRRSA